MPGETQDAKLTESSPVTASPVSATETPPVASPPAAEPPSQAAPAAAEPASPAGPGGRKAPESDPVQEAIAHLARPEPTKAPEKPVEAKPAAEPASKATEAEPDKLAEDPYHGWLDERQKHLLKPATRSRIETLHKLWKGAEAKLAAASTTATPAPSEWDEVIAKENLQEDVEFVPPEHLAGLVRLQAAVNRGAMALGQNRAPGEDAIKAATHLHKVAQDLLKQFGVQSEPPKVPEIEPFKGELPPEMADLVETYGVPEADVRLLVAIKAQGAKPPTSQPAPKQVEAPKAPEQRPQGVDFEALEARRGMAEVIKDGVPAAQYAAYQQVLNPFMARYVQEMYPGIDAKQIPGVFNALPARDRTDLFIRAHREYRAKQSTPPVSNKPPAPTRAQPTSSGTPRPAARAEPTDPVESAVAFLSRRENVE